VSRSLHVAIALLVTGCAANDDVSGPSDETAAAGQGSASSAGSGGAQTATTLGNAGKSGNDGNLAAAGAAGSAAGSGGTLMKDASLADAPIDAALDTGVTDPGTKGDGDFIIGPDYKNAPELTVNATTPKGTIFNFSMSSRDSTIYPGRPDLNPPGDYSRGVWVYIPKQYVDGTPAPLAVVQDGGQYGPDGRGYLGFLPTVLDNLIAAKKVPVMIAVMINPGPGDGQGSERGLEYDTVSDVYATFIEKEALPAVRQDSAIHKAYPNLAFTTNPEARMTMGCSSGAAAAFTMGWFRPDPYRRIVTYSGTFVDQDPKNPIYPHGAWSYGESLIAQSAVKPLRVFLAFGENDNNLDGDPRFHNDMMHNWVTANTMVAAALKAKNYHYRSLFAKGAGHCDGRVTLQTMPETLEWAWRGYPIP